jgi:hypothetical protein
MTPLESRRRRIRVVSSTFKWLATGWLTIQLILAILTFLVPLGQHNVEQKWLGGTWHYSFTLGKSEVIQPGRMWMARTVLAAGCLYEALGAWLFRKLFISFEEFHFFEKRSAQCLKWIGLWMFGIWVVYILKEFSKLGWTENADVQIQFTWDLIAGLIVYLIAWIMDEGRDVKEEQALTI